MSGGVRPGFGVTTLELVNQMVAVAEGQYERALIPKVGRGFFSRTQVADLCAGFNDGARAMLRALAGAGVVVVVDAPDAAPPPPEPVSPTLYTVVPRTIRTVDQNGDVCIYSYDQAETVAARADVAAPPLCRYTDGSTMPCDLPAGHEGAHRGAGWGG